MRRRLILSAVLAMLAAPACNLAQAQAQSWPSRPITIIVPGAPGTAADSLARRIGDQFTSDLGQAVIIENKVGAGGIIAYEQAVRQKPDGHTLTIVVGGFAIAPVIYKNLSFNPVKDFVPITQLALTPMIFVTRPDSPLKTLRDLVAKAKAEPGKLMYGSFGSGSTSHLVGESFKRVAGVNLAHVPYKSGITTVPDVVSGQLDIAIIDPIAALPLIKAGRIKALGVASPQRVPALPDTETVAEAGVPFSAVGWVGLFAPAGLPPDIAAKINASANRAMASAAVRSFLANSGSMPVEPALSVEQWRSRFDGYVQSWGEIARAANMRSD
jgi:tripartite-type tricarboxylate transporter receptor subunit TctC